MNRATEGRQTPAIYGLLLEVFEFVPGAEVGAVKGEVRINPRDGQRYVYILPGTFRMGCSTGDSECYPDESPAHEVSITKGFWLGQTEVTVEAYERFAKATRRPMPAEPKFRERSLNPGWADKRLPMLMVDWNDSLAYCAAAGGRLPTDAEWEYAARGETAGPHYGTLEDIAWFGDNSGKQGLDGAKILKDEQKEYGNKLFANENHPRAGALKKPNGFELYDMLGNAWEWTADWYGEKYYENPGSRNPQGPLNGDRRVLRGGSWVSISRVLRVSYRGRNDPSFRDSSTGLRCAWE